MKRLLPSAVLLLLLAGSAMAEPQNETRGEKGKKKDKGSRHSEFAHQFFSRLDKDQDGAVDQEEFAANPRLENATAEQQERLFQRLDKNGDGFIKRNEFKPPPNMRRGERPRWLEGGPVTYEQFAKQPRVQRLNEAMRKKLFERLDQNNDGVLSKEDSPRRRGERPEGPSPLQEILDSNEDGQLSFSEFQNDPHHHGLTEDEVEDRFEAIDLNSDGLLSDEERKAARKSKNSKLKSKKQR